MKNFLDLKFETDMAIDEYIDTLSPEKAAIVRSMFEFATVVFEGINFRYRKNFDPPSIKISRSGSLGAEGMEGRIILTSGIIDHCINCQAPDVKLIIESLGEDNFINPLIVPSASLAWILSHEQFHIVRQHNRVVEELGGTSDVLMALEHDADLCAAAEIYRVIQGTYGSIISDDKVRELTLYSIFWTLRTFPRDSFDEVHIAMPRRLYHIISKLSYVSAANGSTVDINCEKPETHRVLELLIRCVYRCERSFCKVAPAAPLPFDSLAHEFLRYVESGDFMKIVQAWGNIRADVARISQTRA